nr:symmetrical bis(5'-nucleosyl)-tetraphosphatase [Basilea psittacipulmonis]
MIPDIWAIGDVQGCGDTLVKLLSQPLISDENTQYWFAGDLINRGPKSLQTLRYIMSLGDKAVCVLGNHDLHLLAVYAGIRTMNKSDTLQEILDAPDVEDIIDWLRSKPLAYYSCGHLMVHAGVMSRWDLETTLRLSNEVSQALQSKKWQKYLKKMYGNEPNQWKESLTGSKRLRVIVNGFTRMRMCNRKGGMEFTYKDSPEKVKDALMPWFDVPGRLTENERIVFGHWSTLGLKITKHLLALDTGCVWGGQLSAVRLKDNRLIQVDYCG